MLGTVVALCQHGDSVSKALQPRARKCGSLGLLSIAVVPLPTPQGPVATYLLVQCRLGSSTYSTAHLPSRVVLLHPSQLVILAPLTPRVRFVPCGHNTLSFPHPT